jgi:hypothetical protein
MKRTDGIDVLIDKRLDHLDGPWWMYACTYFLPGDEDTEYHGYIEGDGEQYAFDTLQDDHGNLVKLTTCEEKQ